MSENGSPKAGASFGRYLVAHPGVAASLAYLYVSTLGSVYQWTYFGRFGVNVFDFAEANDFLLAAFRQPLAFLLLIGFLAVYALFAFTDKPATKTAQALAQRLTKTKVPGVAGLGRGLRFVSEGPFWDHPAGMAITRTLWVLVFTMYSVAPMVGTAWWDAERAKTGLQMVCVERRDVAGAERAVFVGSTDRFLFFFDPSPAETHIVPSAAVTRIVRRAGGAGCGT